MCSLLIRVSSFAYVAVLLGACSSTDRRPEGQDVNAAGAGAYAGVAGALVAGGGDASSAGTGSAENHPDAGASDGGASGDSNAAAGRESGAGGDSGAPSASAGRGDDGASGAHASSDGGTAGRGASGGGAGGTATPGAPHAGAPGAGAANTAGAAGTPNDGLMIPCAVQATYTVCHTCHTDPPTNGAPFALVTLSQVQNWVSLEINDVSVGLMPLGSILPEADKQLMIDSLNAGAKGVPQAVCP